jgi:hypothetical protein
LFETFRVEFVDIKGTGYDRPIGTIDGESRVDRLYDKAIANTEPLVGRLKFSAKIGFRAVATAYSVEAFEQ